MRTWKHVGAAGLVLGIALAALPASAHAIGDTDTVQPPESVELSSMLKAAVEERNQQVVSGSRVANQRTQLDHSFSPTAQTRVNAEYAELKARKERLARYGETYVSSKTRFESEKIKIEGTRATAEIVEYTELAYASGPPESYRYAQIAKFAKDGSRWTVDSIEPKDAGGLPPSTVVNDGQRTGTSRAPLQIGPGQVAKPAGPATGPNYVPNSKPASSPEPGQITTFAAGYNYGAMTSYATSWALRRNPDYRQFGNDCQNFVSQSLRAGGWGDHAGWYLSDDGWWYNWGNQSRPWINAQSFHNFAVGKGRVSYLSYLNDLGPADVMQVHWEGTPDVDHSMFVTYSPWSAGTRDIRVSYHTNDTLNRSIWNLYSSFPYATWYALRT